MISNTPPVGGGKVGGEPFTGRPVFQSGCCGHFCTVREGAGTTIFTIGYERRNGDELISLLHETDVEMLVDVREKAMSRKPDFRAAALKDRCEGAGIMYIQMPELGSPKKDRDALRATGDIKTFLRRFRAYAKKNLNEPLNRLAELATRRSLVLLCYERNHEDCHRSAVADFVADRVKASIVAIV